MSYARYNPFSYFCMLYRTFLFVLLSLAFLPTTSVAFSDVTDETKYKTAIEYLADEGIVSGYGDGLFRLEQYINRAEFLKIILELAKENHPEITGENCFRDVTNEWFAKYICYAKARGIVAGYGDGRFYPERNINFFEAAKIITKTIRVVYDYELIGDTDDDFVPLQKLQVQQAIPLDIERLNQELTRGLAAEIIYRFIYSTQKDKNAPKENWAEANLENILRQTPDYFYQPHTLSFFEVPKEELLEKTFWYTWDIQYNDRYTALVLANIFEEFRDYDYLYIKDRQSKKFYRSSQPVSEVAFSNTGEDIYFAAFTPYVVNEYCIKDGHEAHNWFINKKQRVFAQYLKTTVDRMDAFRIENNGERGCSVNDLPRLTRVHLPTMKVEHLQYFGGEEVFVEDNRLIFTQYNANINRLCPRYEYPNGLGMGGGGTNCFAGEHKHVPVIEIDLFTREPLVTYEAKEFFDISQKKKNRIFLSLATRTPESMTGTTELIPLGDPDYTEAERKRENIIRMARKALWE